MINEDGKDQGTRKATLTDQENNKDMYYQEIYSVLERAFQDTFIEELVPGIVHNIANPLNGIMGRSRLLQRKLTDIMKRADVEKDTSYQKDDEKLVRDVDSIAREADRLSVILQTVMGKFCAIGDRTVQKVNLSELIELEMRFFDFYLDFKHSVKKTLQLDKELPEVRGSTADYSLAFSALIRYATVAMKDSAPKELYISTQLENGKICVKIQNRGVPLSDDLKRLLLDEVQGHAPSLGGTRERELLCAFSLLRKWGAGFDIRRENGLNTIIVLMPFYQAKNQFGDYS
jgi:signal transduction histidine kinase